MKVAGTGHRPQKLGGYGEQVLTRLVDLASAALTKHKATLVISGMALGWDTAIAIAAMKLDIPFEAYVPFEGQESRWSPSDKYRYDVLRSAASRVVEVCEPGFAAWKMQKRNEAMVNDCELLLALWDGSTGGTANCVKYANQIGRATHNLWPSWMKYANRKK